MVTFLSPANAERKIRGDRGYETERDDSVVERNDLNAVCVDLDVLALARSSEVLGDFLLGACLPVPGRVESAHE